MISWPIRVGPNAGSLLPFGRNSSMSRNSVGIFLLFVKANGTVRCPGTFRALAELCFQCQAPSFTLDAWLFETSAMLIPTNSDANRALPKVIFRIGFFDFFHVCLGTKMSSISLSEPLSSSLSSSEEEDSEEEEEEEEEEESLAGDESLDLVDFFDPMAVEEEEEEEDEEEEPEEAPEEPDEPEEELDELDEDLGVSISSFASDMCFTCSASSVLN